MYTDAPYHLYESAFATGSSVICNPPILDTDRDFMFLTTDLWKFKNHLVANGWELCGVEEYDQDYWCAMRKGTLNYLLTDSQEYYDKFEKATVVATILNLRDKEQRIMLFSMMTEGELI